MYNHPNLDPNLGSKQLQNKVQFDIHFYLCRRGSENFDEMDKTTFALDYNVQTRIPFVKKVRDEMTKDDKDFHSEITTGFMPQILGEDGKPHKLCPVQHFENNLSHLGPKIPNLWKPPL